MLKNYVFFKKMNGHCLQGSIEHPSGNKELPGVPLFDALVHGVPVMIENGKKVINQNIYDKIMDKLSAVNSEPFMEFDFSKCRFDNVRFNTKMYNCSFSECIFNQCSFANISYISAKLTHCAFHECDFSRSSLYIESQECVAESCNFDNASLAHTIFRNSVINNCTFNFSTVRRSSFFKASLLNPCFKYAKFDAVYFHECSIENADYEGLYITMGGAREDEVEFHKATIFSALSAT